MTKRSRSRGLARMMEQFTIIVDKPNAKILRAAQQKAKAPSFDEFGGQLTVAAAKAYLDEVPDGPKLVSEATPAETQTILGGGGARKRTTRFE